MCSLLKPARANWLTSCPDGCRSFASADTWSPNAAQLLGGEAATAAAILERRLAALPDDAPATAPLLRLLVDVRLGDGDHDGASAAAHRLERLAGDRSPLGVEEARHALGVFERLGAAGKADEAAALLRSLGAAGRTAGRRAGDLTSRERQVLALLGEGLSNAAIAQRLVITEKTAGHHVSRIFRKLGLRNRAEAAAYVLREGVGDEDGR